MFSLETGEKRCLTAPPLYSEPGGSLPVLSPDGRTVAFNRSSTVNQSELYTVALSGGNLRQMTKNGTDCVGTPMWSSDGQYITFNSSRIGLTRVRAADGTAEKKTVYPAIGALSREGDDWHILIRWGGHGDMAHGALQPGRTGCFPKQDHPV